MSLLHTVDANLRWWLTRLFHQPPTAPPDLTILHLSPNFLVVNKPYGLPVDSNDPHRQTVAVDLRRRFPHLADPSVDNGFRFCHRLDFSTSGVLCVALTRRSARFSQAAMEARRSRKYYLGLLRGHVRQESLRMDVAVGSDSRPEFSHRMCAGHEEYCRGARWAMSRLLVLQRGVHDGRPATKVLMRLVSGRRHQLRVHCREIGHTIVGDYTYSDRADLENCRMGLHSYRLTMPMGVEDIDVCAPDPFTEEETLGSWCPHETIRSLNEETFLEV